jgi:cell division protein FtsW
VTATAPAARPGAPPRGRERRELRLLPGGGGPSSRRRRLADRFDHISSRSALVGLVTALCAVGLVMVLSASAYTSLVDYGSVWSIFLRQVIWMALATGAFVGCARVPYRTWQRFRRPILVVAAVLLVAVLVPGLGDTALGSSRWIGFGQLRVQPSEVMKLALALYSADLLARRQDRLDRPGATVVPLVLLLGGIDLLVLLQPDLGTAVVLACIVFGTLWAAGVPSRTLSRLFAGAVAVGAVAALAEPYRRARLLSFIDPMAHRLGSGYQVVQSLVGVSAGRLFGLGLGNGHQKWGLLPNPHTDFIFSVLAEETGFVGAVVVLGLFAAFAVVGLRIAARAPDRFGSLLASAVTCWITAEAVINIGAAIGVLPVTGIPLPFVSFGGSSLVVVMAGAGILANVAGQERRPRRRRPAPAER